PQTAGAEVWVNPTMPGVYLLVNEAFSATQEMLQSNEPSPQIATQHLECGQNASGMRATVCTTRDGRLRIVQPIDTDEPRFLLLLKDETGRVTAAELTTVGTAGDQHLAAGESIRFFRPSEIRELSQF
ncbi:MAG: hypothetical protein ACKO21_12690, partial [Nodosilinea sp.]